MNDDLFTRDYGHPPKEAPERDNLFIWTIVILLLIGLALACWLGSFYVFGHPEKPDSYRILQKLHKLEPPKRFELTLAPAGEFLTPQKAYERYSSMSRFDLERENEAMIRDYINNFQATKRLVPYITGRYTIMRAYDLKNSDFFGSGVIAIAQSVDFPQTLVEHVYPAPAATLPILSKMLAPGLDIKLEKTMDLSAIVRVTRISDGRLQFTVVPLLYGSYALKDGSDSFSLEPPAILNPAGGLPIVRGQAFDDAVKAYMELSRKRMGARIAAGATPAIPVAVPASQTTIVRVEAAPTPLPTPPSHGRGAAAARAGSVAASTPSGVIPKALPVEARSTPAPVAPVVASPAAVAAVTPLPSETPAGSPTATALKVPLVPFLVSSPTPGITANTGATWRTYSAGRMPRGRLIGVSEASDLAERGSRGDRLYLRGSFIVTAVTENKAVLRPSASALANAFASMTRRSDTRVIVEFPAGMLPPVEGANVSRDELRPFEVRNIRRSSDGQLNVFVREVTVP